MEIALAPELERQLAEAVASGRFASASEAMAEGLRRLFAEQDLPAWLTIDPASDDAVPPTLAAALDRAAEDLRLGRTVPASSALADIDARISAYFARRDASIDR